MQLRGGGTQCSESQLHDVVDGIEIDWDELFSIYIFQNFHQCYILTGFPLEEVHLLKKYLLGSDNPD